MSRAKRPAFPKLDIIIRREPHHLVRLLACLSIALGLSSCGGTGQDQGKTATESHAVSGLAIDGYLARSLVFIDYDNNKTRDPWEPYAFTDDDGYFSFNQKTNTDYCASDASVSQQVFCLRTNRRLGDAVIRIDGGYDVMTGEPFYGQLSRRVTADTFTSNGIIIVSPITSLLTEMRSELTKSAILTAMGLHESDLDRDYLDSATTNNRNLLGTSLKLHKTISLISQAVGESYRELGSQAGAMNDASATVYKHLALQLATGYRSFDNIAADPDSIAQIIAATELEVLDYYDHWEISPPYHQGNAMEPSSIAERAADLSLLINTLIDHHGAHQDMSSIIGSIKLIEAMVIKASSGSAALRDSVNFLLNEQNRALLNDLIASLAEANADLVAVAGLDLAASGLNSTDAVRAASQLPAGTTAFRHLPGRKLRVSDMDLGRAPNQLRDSEVEFYFQGNESDTQGAFTACVKYIKDASVDGKLGDANTRGELVKGYWSLLGASQNGGSSYSLLLTIEFLGTRYQAILKPAGTANFNGEDMHGIRFDYGNELRTWHTQNGLEPIQRSPTTAADCLSRLPSRIGL
jgi:hypothetical protein